jgi:hypothetical protein
MFPCNRRVGVSEEERLRPRELSAQTGSPHAEVTMTISVEELRLLLRSDVEAVIRAELQAARAHPMFRRSSTGSARSARQRSPGNDATPPSHDDGKMIPMEVGRSRTLDEPHSRSWLLSTSKYELLANEPEDTLESQASTILPNMGDCMTKIVRCMVSLWSLEEPPRTGCLANFTHSSAFQTFFALAIGVNAAFMVYSVNKDMNSVGSPEDGSPSWMDNVDVCFLSLYCFELVCKLAVHRLFYFWNEDLAWNWLDFLLITQSLVDTMSSSGSGGGNTWMRTIRLFRVAKVLRILRFVKVFTQLHLIMSAILGSLLHLFWSIMVFAILFLMFSLYFVSSVSTFMSSTEGGDKDVVEPMLENFGSVQGSMCSLFMALSGGDDWSVFYDTLTPAGTAGSVFLFFIAFSQIALLNIVTGIFVDNALKISEPDVQQQAEEHFNQDREYAKELKHIFSNGCSNAKTRLTKEDFEDILEDGKLGTYLRFLGIDPIWSKKNLPVLFDRVREEQQLLDGEDDEDQGIEPSVFVERCMALRGHARSTEVMDLQDIVMKIQFTQELILDQLQHEPNMMHGHSCHRDED